MKKRAFHNERSCFWLEPNTKIRNFLIDLVENQWFDYFILVIIFVNCVFLALDDQPPAGSSKGDTFFCYIYHIFVIYIIVYVFLAVMLEVADIIFTSIFGIEMILKISAFGFIFAGPGSYLRDPWNRMDFVVVFLAYVDIYVFICYFCVCYICVCHRRLCVFICV